MLLSASLFLAAALTQPGAQDWRTLDERPEASLAWDAAGVVRQGELTIVPIRIAHMPPVEGANAYAISRLEIRCDRNEGRVAETMNYASDGTPGEHDVDNLPFRSIPDNSFLAAIRNLVCTPRT